MSSDHPSQAGYDLFLSHSSADKPWVRQLRQALEHERLRVFLSEIDIHAPENYVLTLNDALWRSRFLVLVAAPPCPGRSGTRSRKFGRARSPEGWPEPRLRPATPMGPAW